MPTLLPSYKRQQLLLEFAAIKSKCPEGIYLSPTPANPTSWSGVYFVRQGPYTGTVLRFEILFPPAYPDIGPSFSFSTEAFHPLLVPLTTYTFAAGALDPNATFSSSEAQRLPPGSFNIQECLPSWYLPRKQFHSDSQTSEVLSESAKTQNDAELVTTESDVDTPTKLLTLLYYVKKAFEDANFLDVLSLRAAVNTNAWHAWRAHRGLPKMASRSVSPASVESGRTPLSPGKTPGDWNWDGVWESRARNGTEESVNDAVLFGSKNGRPSNTASSQIRFSKNDDERTREIQDAMMQAVGFTMHGA